MKRDRRSDQARRGKRSAVIAVQAADQRYGALEDVG
jgi:hypothetical protein